MPKRALVEDRPWLLASIAISIAYFALRSQPIDEFTVTLMKGGGVAFLAIYAWNRGSDISSKILALVMALSALGDMLIEVSLVLGGAAFFFSHLVAIWLYLKNMRQHPSTSQKGAAVALVLLTPLVCWLLTENSGVTLYGVALGGMAAAAWMSKFSRYHVGLGAIFFVVSDWLIFGRIAYPDGAAIFGLLIWPIYYVGQLLIATGVSQTLRNEMMAAD